MWWNNNQIFSSLSVLMNKLENPNGLYIFICEKFLKIIGNHLRYSADHVHIHIQSFSTTNLNTKIRIQIIKIMTELKIITKMTSFIPQDWSGTGLLSVSHYMSMLTVSMSFEQSFVNGLMTDLSPPSVKSSSDCLHWRPVESKMSPLCWRV